MRRSAHPSLSPQPRSPCPRRGLRPPTSHRTAARRAAGAAAKCSAPHACTHSTPRASAARSHPRPWTFRPFSQHLSLQVLGALRHRTQHRERARLIKRRNQSFALPSRILHHVSAVCHVKSWQGLIPKAHTHIRGGSDTTPPKLHTQVRTLIKGTHSSRRGRPGAGRRRPFPRRRWGGHAHPGRGEKLGRLTSSPLSHLIRSRSSRSCQRKSQLRDGDSGCVFSHFKPFIFSF